MVPVDVTDSDPAMLRNPRLLFVVNVDWYFVSHRLPLAVAARELGWEVSVAAAETTCRAQLEQLGIHFVPLRFRRKSRQPAGELWLLFQLIRLYRQARPSIVHNVTLKPVLYGSIAARFFPGVTVVNAIAGTGGVLAALESIPARLLGRVLGLIMPKKRGLVIFQNRNDAALFTDIYHYPSGRTRLIPGSGVNIREYSPAPPPPGAPIILLASRLLWPKGLREFVAAASIVRKRYPQSRFVIVGEPDPDSSLSVPHSQLAEWTRRGAVEWWGRREDMAQVLRQASIVTLPTYYGEGVPKVLIEAAAAGRAIVTTDTPGCSDIVRQDFNGLLIPPRDASALAAAIIKLLEDPGRSTEFGLRGRELVEAEFSIERVVTDTLNVYYELLNIARRRVARHRHG